MGFFLLLLLIGLIVAWVLWGSAFWKVVLGP